MKKFVAVLIVWCCLAPHLGFAQDVKADDAGYKLVWADEFNKEGSPDTTNWNFEQGFMRNKEAQWYQKQNAFCHNGLLVIEAQNVHLPNPNYIAGSNNWRTNREFIEYTSASMNTNRHRSWQYGRFVMRARIDIDSGLWPAFWTLGINKPWPSSGEIDIMEYYSGKLLANIIFGTNTAYKAKYNSSAKPITDFAGNWSKKFHIWRMDWDENGISLYVDDILLKHDDMKDIVNLDNTNFNPFMQPHYLLLDLALAGDNGGDPSKTKFPRRFSIDYIRIYQQNKKRKI